MSDFSDIIKLASKKPQMKKKVKYEIPKWFKSIKPGSHGGTPTQKRVWTVVSEYVRRRDFEKYGKCASCGNRFGDWKNGQAGHFKPWSVCHSYFKYNVANIALQCAYCNSHNAGADTGHSFGEELKKRYGEHHLDWIEEENEKYRGVKMQDNELVDMVAKLMPELVK